MSSLNQAFIKAYGKEAPAPQATPAPAPTAQASAPPRVLDSWYAADSWYRADAATPVPGLAPHAAFPAAYEPPTTAELKSLFPRASDDRLRSGDEDEYRLLPIQAPLKPELVVEDDRATAPSAAPRTPPVLETIARVEPPPTVAATPPVAASPVAVPSATAIVATPTPAAVAAVVPAALPPSLDLASMFAPVQVLTGWSAGVSAIDTWVAPPPSPVPVVAPPAKKKEPVAPAPVVAAPAASPAVERTSPPPAMTSARLDPPAAPPVPKPHAHFAPAMPETAAPVPAPAPTETAEASRPLQPAWEVDRFQFPHACQALLAPDNGFLNDVGQRLATAANDGLRILAVTSTRRGEGRTTLSLCLARAAAQAGVKVALLDADIENPQLVNELGVEAACGWQDVVLGTQPLAEAAILSLDDKFTFFPWTSSSGLATLNDPQVTRVLRRMATEFQLVILDLGPVPGRETRLFEDGDQCPVDAAILVRDIRWTSALEAQRVAAQLVAAGVQSVGIAENFGPRTHAA